MSAVPANEWLPRRSRFRWQTAAGAIVLLLGMLTGAIPTKHAGSPPSGGSCPTGNIINAASASSTNVNMAISSASNGDCVVLPASSSATWTDAVSLSSAKWIKLDLNGSTITLSGASGTFAISSHASGLNRITNGNVVKALATGYTNYAGPFIIHDTAGGYGIRVDHIAFTQTGSWSGAEDVWIDADAQGPGVLDHNTFSGMQNTQEFIHFLGWGPGNTTGWTTDSNSTLAGGSSLLYLEDNTFTAGNSLPDTNSPVLQGYYGARVGYRHNTFDYTRIDMHGTSGSVGQRWWEVDSNLWQNTTNNTGNNLCTLNVRAGTGVVHDNDVGWGSGYCFCEEDSSGYPADYQVGRGQNQALDPAYQWSDTMHGRTIVLNDCDGPGGYGPDYIQDQRDIYLATTRPSYSSYTYPHPLAN